jgi:spore coat polysaccharide biosynthesis protein SpsF (cytidylyltransferase family)
MSSTRLPGKVLEDLGGRPVLEHVLQRCRTIPGIDVVCCATVEGGEGDPIEALATRMGAAVTRGSREDVLSRYDGAASALDADVVVRVTSDCPLIDPSVCGRVLALLLETGAALACNNMPRTWPHGLDCEAFTSEWLQRAANEASEPFQREHVTPFIRDHPDARVVNLEGPGGDVATQRWTLDTSADLRFLRALFGRLPEDPASFDYRVPLGLVSTDPELEELQEACRPARREG